MLRSKSLFSWSALFALLLLTYVSVGAQDLVVSDSLLISSDTAFDNVTILDGGVLIADAQIDVLVNMQIDSGGVVTHSSRYLDGLVLNVTDSLVIQPGGMIDLTAKGLLGGLGGSAFGLDGETFDSTGVIVAGAGGGQPGGADGGAGGSYGGWGATAVGLATAPYGLLENPSHLGSGGGGYQYEGRRGGNGGGKCHCGGSSAAGPSPPGSSPRCVSESVFAVGVPPSSAPMSSCSCRTPPGISMPGRMA